MRKSNWSSEEDQILKKNYGKIKNKEICLLLKGRNVNGISQRAMKLGINKINYKIWSIDDLEYLKLNYNNSLKSDLIDKLNTTWEAIKAKAKNLGLRRRSKQMEKINGKIEYLLLENSQSYYWIGFLLADAHFSKKYRLKLSISPKDLNHIERFAKYIKSSVIIEKSHMNFPSVTIMDTYYIKLLIHKFDIHSNKTYNPPNINMIRHIPSDLFFCLLCGFIDGDGCIRKQYKRNDSILSIKIHNSWCNILTYMLEFLQKYFDIQVKSQIHFYKNYCYFIISNNKLLTVMKNKAIEFNLPLMERKWNNIN